MKVDEIAKYLNLFFLVNALFSYALFLKCYFPLKQGLSGHSSLQTIPPEPFTGRFYLPQPSCNRLVLMIIDALRTDFVLGGKSYMPFTQQLLQDEQGVAFSARTHLPTVTLPRIKAITSGSIPGFVDVVLNFGSSSMLEDNLIAQLKLAGKTVIFFGDDTWLSLFPEHFARADGTSSFFVSDFTEVDINVTRHLHEELAEEDWDVMILHYLGLDHIGHVYGPASKLIAPKLLEMDNVVHQIFTAMKFWERPSMLVICGDHGMSDQGGHGGASAGETNVPIIIISPHAQFPSQIGQNQELQQIDLCPSLSALLGLPIPRNNLGRVEVAALPLNTSLEDRVRLLQVNAALIVDILNSNFGDVEKDRSYQFYQELLAAHSLWLSTQNSSSSKSWETAGIRILTGYQDVVRKMSQQIGQFSTSYDMYSIVIAITLLSLNLLNQFLRKLSSGSAMLTLLPDGIMLVPFVTIAILGHLTMCTSQYSSEILCSMSLISVFLQFMALGSLMFNCVLLGNFLQPVIGKNLGYCNKPKDLMETSLISCLVLHCFSLLSSSFVEEEHQTWYFFTTSIHTFLLISSLFHLCVQLAYPRDSGCMDISSHYHIHNQYLPSLGFFVSKWTRSTDSVSSQTEQECSPEQTRLPQEVTLACYVKMTASLLCMLFLFRVLRRWNQTGNKWLDIPDIGDWLIKPENKKILTGLVLASLLCLLLIRLRSLHGLISRTVFVGALSFIYLSKAATGSLLLPSILTDLVSSQSVFEARITYAFILGILVCGMLEPSAANVSVDKSSKLSRLGHMSTDNTRVPGEYPHTSQSSEKDCNQVYIQMRDRHKAVWECIQLVWLLVMCLLLRPHNIVEVMMVFVIETLACGYVLPLIQLRPSAVFLYCLMVGQASFFFQGNSNSLSTVDVSAGLKALYDYQPVIIAVQMTMSTYAGVFYWLFSCCKYLASVAPVRNTKQWLSDAYIELCSTVLLTRALPLAIYTMLTTHLRFHLFVWTVFSPKLLYEGMLTLVMSGFCFLCLLMACRLQKTN